MSDEHKLSRLTELTTRNLDSWIARQEGMPSQASEGVVTRTGQELIAFADGLFAGDQEQRQSVRVLVAKWEGLLADLDAMSPGDPLAQAAIDRGFGLLRLITMSVGHLHGFDYASRVRLHQASLRLLSEGRPVGYRIDGR